MYPAATLVGGVGKSSTTSKEWSLPLYAAVEYNYINHRPSSSASDHIILLSVCLPSAPENAFTYLCISLTRWPSGQNMECARTSLLELSKKHPDLLDVSGVDRLYR